MLKYISEIALLLSSITPLALNRHQSIVFELLTTELRQNLAHEFRFLFHIGIALFTSSFLYTAVLLFVA